MPYIVLTEQSTKDRILITGKPNTGKTDSLATFIYGTRDYQDDSGNLTKEAIEYANDRKMVVLTAPGEKGVKSLPSGPHITNYVYQTKEDGSDSSSVVIKEFEELTGHVIYQEKPDILAVDGSTKLYDYWLDALSGGEWFTRGIITTETKRGDELDETGKYIGRCHTLFGSYLAKLFNCPVPIVVVTCWQELENRDENLTREQQIHAVKQQWPALPGKMAKKIAGEFDCVLSASVGVKCWPSMVGQCEEGRMNQEHYLWQFLPKGDVAGVGIKGMKRIKRFMKDQPYIHQNYRQLKQVMEICR